MIGALSANTVTSGDSSLRLPAGVAMPSVDPFEVILQEVMGSVLTDLHQQGYKRLGFEGGVPAVLRRIDRRYASAGPPSLLRHSIRAGVAWPLECCDPMSDPAPHSLASSLGARCAASIPRWAAGHPPSATSADEAIGDFTESWDALERLSGSRR